MIVDKSRGGGAAFLTFLPFDVLLVERVGVWTEVVRVYGFEPCPAARFLGDRPSPRKTGLEILLDEGMKEGMHPVGERMLFSLLEKILGVWRSDILTAEEGNG